jgi:acetyltransferase
MVAEQRRIKEVDINPLLASPEGCLALDARVVLYEAAIPDAEVAILVRDDFQRKGLGAALLQRLVEVAR